jgi:hypothetical protein
MFVPPDSIQPSAVEQIGHGLDDALAVFEEPLGVAPDEIDLVLPALLPQRPDVVDRMGLRQLRNKFGEEVRLGFCAIKHFVADEEKLVEHHALDIKEKVHGRLFTLARF